MTHSKPMAPHRVQTPLRWRVRSIAGFILVGVAGTVVAMTVANAIPRHRQMRPVMNIS